MNEFKVRFETPPRFPAGSRCPNLIKGPLALRRASLWKPPVAAFGRETKRLAAFRIRRV